MNDGTTFLVKLQPIQVSFGAQYSSLPAESTTRVQFEKNNVFETEKNRAKVKQNEVETQTLATKLASLS